MATPVNNVTSPGIDLRVGLSPGTPLRVILPPAPMADPNSVSKQGGFSNVPLYEESRNNSKSPCAQTSMAIITEKENYHH